MGRVYAGVLGPIAFLTVLARGAMAGGFETTLITAVACLFAFGAVGAVVGRLAGWIVDESVRTRFGAELRAQSPPDGGATASART